MNKYNVFMKEILWEILGSLFVSIGIYNFAVHSKFPVTGFSGISLILNHLFSFPIGLTIIILNIPVSLLCYKLLGRKFFIRSLRCMIISSLMIDYIAPLLPVYQGSRMLSAICTGVLGGFGYALIYMKNSSTGGTDFIIMSVKALKPYLSIGKIAFWSDVGIILIGGIIYKDIDGIIYGMIINFLFAVVVDKTVYGINAGKLTLIVTENGKAVADIIEKSCGRGSTLLKASGGYKEDKKQVVMCACNNKQMYFVQKAVKEFDENSFIIILESNEVHGEGFNMFNIGNSDKI